MAENDDREARLTLCPNKCVKGKKLTKRILHRPTHLRGTGNVLHPNGASQPQSRIKHESCSIYRGNEPDEVIVEVNVVDCITILLDYIDLT